jgi:hypothetical protein
MIGFTRRELMKFAACLCLSPEQTKSGSLKYGLIAAVLALAPTPALTAEPPNSFEISYAAGARDASGQLKGGTEIRNLVAHDGRLFAANGYWKDSPGLAGTPGAQILVLDAPGKPWRVDHEFDDLLCNGRRRHLAISALSDVTFHTDSRGGALDAPVFLLLASTWDITGRRTVFARDSRTGAWSGVTMPVAMTPTTRRHTTPHGSHAASSSLDNDRGPLSSTLYWAKRSPPPARFAGLGESFGAAYSDVAQHAFVELLQHPALSPPGDGGEDPVHQTAA